MDDNQFRILMRVLEMMVRTLRDIEALVKKIEDRIPADLGMEAD